MASPLMWLATQGDTVVDVADVYAGVYALSMGGGGGTALTQPLDTTSCTNVAISWQGKEGP